MTGHTVHDGGGALDDLEELAVGAEVRVVTARGPTAYVVSSVEVLDKDAIARQAPDLFSQDVPGRLVLVTCEGWDGSGYTSNVVVTATPTT
jgi:sortase (surface protein transpeptidase)